MEIPETHLCNFASLHNSAMIELSVKGRSSGLQIGPFCCYSDSLARITIWSAHFPFYWVNPYFPLCNGLLLPLSHLFDFGGFLSQWKRWSQGLANCNLKTQMWVTPLSICGCKKKFLWVHYFWAVLQYHENFALVKWFSVVANSKIHLFHSRLLPWTMFHSLQCTMVNRFVAGSLVLFTFIEIMETICEKALKRAFK